MNNILNENKKKNKVKLSVLIVTLVFLIVGVFASFIAICIRNESKSNLGQDIVHNNFIGELQDSPYVALSFSASTYSVENNTVSKEIKAIVKPETAANKTVDWEVSWYDKSIESDVSAYIEVEPDFDGSTTATITCHQRFDNDILITVITRDGGHRAFCVVKFVGEPNDIILNCYNLTLGSDCKYSLTEDVYYNLSFSLSNIFGTVGEKFNNLEISYELVGEIKVADYTYSSSYGGSYIDGTETTISLDSIRELFVTVSSVYDNTCVIKQIASIESYYSSSYTGESGRNTIYENKFKEFIGDCYFKITVTETVSGCFKEFKFNLASSEVSSVELDNTIVEF